MKVCSRCKIEKELTEFNKRIDSKDGLRSQCKSCRTELTKKYREKNKERVKERRKKDYQQNKERYKEVATKWRQQNKERKKELGKKYYQQNKERLKERARKWSEQNKEHVRKRNKKNYQKNKERYKERYKEYYAQNKERIKKYIKEYERERRKTDPLFKMKCNLRGRTWSAFKSKGYYKNTKTQEILGVNWEVCKAHVERQFTKGMNWDNHGDWHIDHIIPLSSAKTEEELIKLCHYSNLQPLWAKGNISKSDKIIETQVKLRI